MQRKIKFLEIEYPEIMISQRDTYKLRGYFADQNCSNEYMHNHTADGKRVIYRYPMVQYKRWRGHPFIITFGAAIPSVHRAVMQTDELIIGEKIWPADHVEITIRTKLIGDCVAMTRYRFLSPWLCLNQKNYKKYVSMAEDEKKQFLKKILDHSLYL